MAPPLIANTPQANEFADNLMTSWPSIRDGIPRDVLAAATTRPNIEDGMLVALADEDDQITYAVAEQGVGQLVYRAQWLDTFATPHDTGTYVPQWRAARSDIVPVVTWTQLRREEDEFVNPRADPMTATRPTSNQPRPRTSPGLHSQSSRTRKDGIPLPTTQSVNTKSQNFPTAPSNV